MLRITEVLHTKVTTAILLRRITEVQRTMDLLITEPVLTAIMRLMDLHRHLQGTGDQVDTTSTSVLTMGTLHRPIHHTNQKFRHIPTGILLVEATVGTTTPILLMHLIMDALLQDLTMSTIAIIIIILTIHMASTTLTTLERRMKSQEFFYRRLLRKLTSISVILRSSPPRQPPRNPFVNLLQILTRTMFFVAVVVEPILKLVTAVSENLFRSSNRSIFWRDARKSLFWLELLC
mmetsp:Transcript_21977/g.45198  ORF Transcript_21977/g.45198 Transcript_21977/m.45198 type:complete len:234 (+) Transcript_21977:1135-1836(+)